MSEDWEKARDWLKQKTVTRMSAKVRSTDYPQHFSPTNFFQNPGLEELLTEYDLYVYLKDGTELCRMIGLLTKGRVPEGIIYETNNMSALEEKNLLLFIKIVEEEFADTKDLKHIFKKPVGKGTKMEAPELRHEIFTEFSDFGVVLTWLSKLSKAIQKKHNIPPFNSSGRPTRLVQDDEKTTMLWETADTGGKKALKSKEDKKRTTEELDSAVEEMINFNDSFLHDVLTELKSRQEDAKGNELLNREFFDTLKLEVLIDLHMKLQKRFQRVKYSYVDIGDTFEEVKDNFLIYCDIATRSALAMNFLADQISKNEDIGEILEEIERSARARSTDTKSFKSTIDLVQMIQTCMMKWPFLLEEIAKQADAEIKEKAKQAKDITEDIVKGMEQVAKDVQYITAMKVFKREIQDFPPNIEFHHYGPLKKEITTSFSPHPMVASWI